MLDTKEELWVKKQIMAEEKGKSSAASAGSAAKHWRVEISTHGEQILAIETEMYSGKADLTADDIETIRTCATHLLAFIGG